MWPQAGLLLQEAQEKRLEANVVVLTSVISACASAGAGMQAFRLVQEQPGMVNVLAYHFVVAALEMCSSGSTPMLSCLEEVNRLGSVELTKLRPERALPSISQSRRLQLVRV